MAQDLATSGSTSATMSISTTETPSTTISTVSTTTSSVMTSPSAATKNGTANHGYLTPNNFSRTTATTFGPISPHHNLESSLTTKDIVLQLRQYAQNPHQQIHLMNNTEFLRIISDCLDDTTTHSKTEMCIISLQTLQLLATNPNYRETLKSVPNLNARIETLCSSTQLRLQNPAKNLKTTLHSNTPLNKLQQFQPRPLHKIEFAITNLNTVDNRDRLQTMAVKLNGVVAVTADLNTRMATFWTRDARENLRRQILIKLKGDGFQVQSDPDDDAVSVHSIGATNFVNRQDDLISLRMDGDDPFGRKKRNDSKGSIIPERFAMNDDEDEAESKGDNGASGGIFSLKGPSYVEPQIMNKSGITKYKDKHHVESLQQRLQREQMMKEMDKKKEQHAQSFINKAISYLW